MANIRIILDRRKSGKNMEYPVRIYVYHNGKQLYIPTGISASDNTWDDNTLIKGKDTSTKAKNALLRDMMNRCEALHLNLAVSGELQRLTAKELRARIDRELNVKSRSGYATLYEYLNKAKIGKAERTVRLFKWAQDRVDEFCGRGKAVSDIDDKWITAFRDSLLKNYAPNTVAQAMAWISRAMSIAVADGVIAANPARGVKKPSAPTRKRAVTVEVVRQLRDMKPVNRVEILARDIFLLQLYLRGINIADLYDLTEIVDGRVEYVRHKTKILYSVKIEPEAMEIIERYRNDSHLIDFSRYSTPGVACSVITTALKRLVPKLSTNAARHTWATIAAELEMPIETISHALGHQIGSPVTAIYVAFNQRKVDEANRRVIDYVNADLKKGKE